MKTSRVIRNILFLVFINLFLKPFWVFGIDRVVQNKIGNQQYGQYASLLSLSLMFVILLDLGISNYNQKKVASTHGSVHTEFGKIASLKLILALVYVLTLNILFFVFHFDFSLYPLFISIIGVQIFSSFTQFIRSYISGLHIFTVDSVMSVIDKFIAIILCGYFIYFSHLKISLIQFSIAQLLGFLITVVIGIVFLYQNKYLTLGRITFSEVLNILKFCLPYALIVLAMSIYTKSDAFFIRTLIKDNSEENAGQFQAAYRILEVLSMVALLMANVLLPIFSKNISENKSSVTLIKTITDLVFPLTFIFAAWISLNALDICNMIYTNEPSQIAYALKILIFSLPAYFIMYIFSTYISGSYNLKPLIIWVILLAGLYIVLSLIFLPIYKLTGAIYISVFIQWIAAIGFILICYFKFSIRIPLVFWIKYIPIIFCSILLTRFVSPKFSTQIITLGVICGLYLIYFLKINFNKTNPINNQLMS